MLGAVHPTIIGKLPDSPEAYHASRIICGDRSETSCQVNSRTCFRHHQVEMNIYLIAFAEKIQHPTR